MISPHSDALVAERAGFPARTLAGACLLGRVVSVLSGLLDFRLQSVRRVAASFAAPVPSPFTIKVPHAFATKPNSVHNYIQTSFDC